MKKLISMILLAALVLTCCACAKTGTTQTPETTLDPMSNEAKFGHIDQTVPENGVYKIWNSEGVRLMTQHPEASFELLCNVDMQGATLAPIEEFTGELNGGNCVISNFTLQGGAEENFGFVTVNKGDIHNLTLENVTFLPGDAKCIGTIAGTNEGKLTRCTLSGTLAAEAKQGSAIGSLVGANSGQIRNSKTEVAMTVTGDAQAFVGGITGTSTAPDVEYVDVLGAITITGQNKTVGLFAGDAQGTVYNKCAFVGADNSLNGKLFTNFTGTEDDELQVCIDALWRDNDKAPLPQNVQALRDKVVQAMYELGTVEWHVKEDVVHNCTCQLEACHGTYNSLYTYYGTPYNHKSSSLARIKYCIGDDMLMDDWVYEMPNYDGYDIYFGTDCSSSVQQAWWTVSNSVNCWTTHYMIPAEGMGTIPVGDYVCDFKLTGSPLLTQKYIDANTDQMMYESYAQLRKGDAYVYLVKEGGHVRMAAEDAVVVRDQQGLINPDYSYVISHEQGMSTMSSEELRYSSWRVNYKYTFANLYFDTAVPFTCQELLTGEMEPVEASLEGGCDGYTGMITGTVKSNYNIDSVTLRITDSKGNEVLNHPMWVSVLKTEDWGGNAMQTRSANNCYDLANFAIVLANTPLKNGETYSYSVTADLYTFDHIKVHEGTFTNG